MSLRYTRLHSIEWIPCSPTLWSQIHFQTYLSPLTHRRQEAGQHQEDTKQCNPEESSILSARCFLLGSQCGIAHRIHVMFLRGAQWGVYLKKTPLEDGAMSCGNSRIAVAALQTQEGTGRGVD